VSLVSGTDHIIPYVPCVWSRISRFTLKRE
jgi:hypothetical protein